MKLPGLLLGKTVSTSVEILVEKSPGESGRVGLRGRRRDFVLTPDTVFTRDPGSEAALRKAPAFDFRGRIDSDVISILGRGPMLKGVLTVGSNCQTEVKSVELQLLRVESVNGSRRLSHTSEVQTIQVAEGGVARGVEVPMRMVLPRRHFVCESVHLAGLFSVDFEVNVVVLFGKNFVVAENVPLTVVRHQIENHS